MKVRFLSDENFNRRIREGLEQRFLGIDILTADQANLRGRLDPEVLSAASTQGRVLLSHDIKTMPVHFRDRLLATGGCSGVLLVPQRTPIGRAIEDVGAIWDEDDAEDWVDRLGWI